MTREAYLCLVLALAGSMQAECQPRIDTSSEQSVVLRTQVIVYGEQLHFSDLLPSDAPVASRREAESISLGRAPQPGSFRLLRKTELQKIIGSKLSAAMLGDILVLGGGWPIRPDAVRQALQAQHAFAPGMDIFGVHLPTELETRAEDPRPSPSTRT